MNQVAKNTPGKKNDKVIPGDRDKLALKEKAEKVKVKEKERKASSPRKKTEKVTLQDRWLKIKNFFTNVYNELKKVYWPGRRALLAYTGVVLLAVFLVSLMIWFFDSIISWLIELLFKAFA